MRRLIDPWMLRRIALLVCAALVVVAISLFLNVQLAETHGGTVELIDGQPDAGALELPLALFVVGATGLLLALAWKPSRE